MTAWLFTELSGDAALACKGWGGGGALGRVGGEGWLCVGCWFRVHPCRLVDGLLLLSLLPLGHVAGKRGGSGSLDRPASLLVIRCGEAPVGQLVEAGLLQFVRDGQREAGNALPPQL